jgi:hypothetical protein
VEAWVIHKDGGQAHGKTGVRDLCQSQPRMSCVQDPLLLHWFACGRDENVVWKRNASHHLSIMVVMLQLATEFVALTSVPLT